MDGVVRRITLDFVSYVGFHGYLPLLALTCLIFSLAGSHTGVRMAHAVHDSLKKFRVERRVCLLPYHAKDSF